MRNAMLVTPKEIPHVDGIIPQHLVDLDHCNLWLWDNDKQEWKKAKVILGEVENDG